MIPRGPNSDDHQAADGDPQDAPALVALTQLGRDAAKPHTAAELDQGLDAVVARLAAGQAHRRAVRRWGLLGVAATAAALVALALGPLSRDKPVIPETPVAVARVEGGTLLEGGYLSPSGTRGVKVLFNEGTTFELMPGARGRLREVARDGAQFAVEHGTASFGVTRSREHHWLVEAGPFLVTVKGTVFTVSWDSSSERFELRLRQGHVVVSGPVASGGIALHGGQRLVVSLPKAETVITDEKPGPGADVSTDAPQPAAPPVVARELPRVRAMSTSSGPARASATREVHPRRWAADLADGRWDRILSDVDRDGVDVTLENAASDDLFALADAARYRRRADLARAALLAERRRFPGARRSSDALFLLGRVEELREHGTRAQAIVWYDAYLAQAPRGAYAAEALGRKMILANEVGGPEQARPIAREYLVRFPNGSYAGSARALERVP